MSRSPVGLSIVYCGPLNEGGTCGHRAKALESLGVRLTPIDILPGDLARRQRSLAWRVRRRLVGDRDEAAVNARLLALPATPTPDVLWIDTGLVVEPSTLRALRARWPSARFINYSGDDMFNPNNQSPAWRASIGLYDLFVTTKSFNVPELKAAGARDIHFVEKGFSPEVHRPYAPMPELVARFGGDVGFVGWPEGVRERGLRLLARHGIDVRVWGPWPRWKSAPHLRIEGRPLWDADYARALSSFRINMGFLRRVNRDRHTTRSVEIPACGGFLLAERTDEHLRLFREGVEAEYFEGENEMLEKVRYYLTHESERARIAAAGLRRCLEGGYSNQDRLASALRYALAPRTTAAAAAEAAA